MAIFPIDIPGAQLQRVIDGLCLAGRYSATVRPGGVPNAETKAQFARRRAAMLIKNDVQQAERQALIAAAPAPPDVT